MYKRVAVITGMPRSGTSWIGQIVDSSPQVRYRMSPLFSYEFKNYVREGARREDWEHVLRGSYGSDNEFMNQSYRRDAGEYPTFARKEVEPELLVVKFNRFQNLIEEMLDLLPEVKMVAVVRHPCGTIHSWLTAPKEFPPDADPMEHWRSGACKKTGYGDNFGFDDWKWVTRLHVRLAAQRPQQFRLIRYEPFVRDPIAHSRDLLAFFDLTYSDQTADFLARSQRDIVPGDYSVFKPPSVADRWRDELQPAIRDAIVADLRGTDLETFLD
ncbi:MAG: sulfotransferase [Myxococcota bacterium]